MFSPQHGRLVTWLQTNTTLFVLFLKTELKGVLNLRQLNSKNNYLFINFAKRPGSLTEQAPLQGLEKKKKISNTTNKNDNYTLIETTKKRNTNAK